MRSSIQGDSEVKYSRFIKLQDGRKKKKEACLNLMHQLESKPKTESIVSINVNESLTNIN
jgi:hypothetical protein